MKDVSTSVLLVTGLAVGFLMRAAPETSSTEQSRAAAGKTSAANIPYADAKPILQVLREDLLPAELRSKTPAELEAVWPDWVSRRDATIRARVEQGDEDSVVHFLLFGTMFTKEPMASE